MSNSTTTNTLVEYSDTSTHIGDNHFETIPHIERIIKNLMKREFDNKTLIMIQDELNEFVEIDNSNRSIIGLEEKLTRANKTSRIDKAQALKHRFEKKCLKKNMFELEQIIYTKLFHEMVYIWNTYIEPKISDKSYSLSDLDEDIFKRIITPFHSAISIYDPLVNNPEIEGMMYFLTGKCHLNWI